MSLINEALKKAHQEAQSRAAAEGRPRYPYAPLHGGAPARRPGLGRTALVSGGIAVGIGIALLTVVALGRGDGGATEQAGLAPTAAEASGPALAVEEAAVVEEPAAEEPAAKEPVAQEPVAEADPVTGAGAPTEPEPVAEAVPMAEEAPAERTVPAATPAEPRATPPVRRSPPEAAPSSVPAPPVTAQANPPVQSAPPPRDDPPAARGHGLSLDGVFWSERFAQAMINGRTVRVGDRVGEYTVIEIVPRGVVLEGEGGEVRLTM